MIPVSPAFLGRCKRWDSSLCVILINSNETFNRFFLCSFINNKCSIRIVLVSTRVGQRHDSTQCSVNQTKVRTQLSNLGLVDSVLIVNTARRHTAITSVCYVVTFNTAVFFCIPRITGLVFYSTDRQPSSFSEQPAKWGLV